ncbi:CYTH domain-containing protein [Staphylococcus devriesei]|uniref:CYTH domain-containing protein n=2 Tax=Staphylococcus devriesei TaxID=586733 RepID=A0ABX5HZ91_9STAP|nr:CYTH domain-containing protein [Staphylococcus devriesei]MCE5089316.1 CYTH domain-containing protein [Staphylococcus devriesei]PNZ87514.1 adenylate cyclase [Staphylococcus devriesei]PTF02340.1 CYTH domain-containing protein [Staphylococcus devriesei]PTF13000.1 CYTH domain-containing protein [Staphylococcus devriesei]PTF19203.1 CYTH domain-containing protein [Staphylococcus devriesei]
MATNNEIEFKQLLDVHTYEKIKTTYFEGEEPFSQTNYYIDTPDFKLRNHKSALRIRVKNETYEMTLKVPAKVGLTEYNHMVNVVPKVGTTISKANLPSDIKYILDSYGVEDKELNILGALTTIRMETNYKNELLVLDKSEYFDKTDYELEFEVQNYDQGLEKFERLLEKFQLKHETPKNKVQRFFDYKSLISK